MGERGDGSPVAGWTRAFVDEVFPAEYATVMARRREVTRRAAARERRAAQDPEDRSDGTPAPSVRLRLFGLAFSGGGIRSATFNLGVIQSLAKRGLLPRFDYLSTVSGGGFIGGCLSALLNDPATDTAWDERFPFFLRPGRPEPAALRHLRSHSSYLATGTLGYFALAAVLLRGMLVNILTLTPLVVLAVAWTHWMYGPGLTGGARSSWPSFTLTGGALAAFGLAVALFPVVAWFARRRGVTDARALYRRHGVYAVLLGVPVALAVVESLPVALAWFHAASPGTNALSGVTWASLAGAVLPSGDARGDARPGPLATLGGALKLLAASLAGPLLLLLIYLVLADWVVFPDTAPVAPSLVPWVVYGGGAALLLYTAAFVDANATSNHQFYRDRLSLAYLFQRGEGDALRPTDALRLTELNAQGTVAPLHLINTTINLHGERRSLRGREADVFFFSRHYSGSARTGYASTATLEAADRGLNLGTAVAISGAAVSPSMGSMTIRSLALVMTLLNARLGYWLVHPARARDGARRSLARLGAGVRQLLTEAAGRPTATGAYVNVSDGGHLENLGVFELLRRRCRVIVCSDGEHDPAMSFVGLAALIRLAATELGVHIDINLDALRLDADGRSARHHAIGRVDYGDGEVGWLLYIKLSIGARELPYIEQYRRANPEFPHQSTGDQFFDEAQFEAYRALGFKVGARTMDALDELARALDDVDGPLSFDGAGQGGGDGSADAPAGDAIDDALRKSFRPAADPAPPW